MSPASPSQDRQPAAHNALQEVMASEGRTVLKDPRTPAHDKGVPTSAFWRKPATAISTTRPCPQRMRGYATRAETRNGGLTMSSAHDTETRVPSSTGSIRIT